VTRGLYVADVEDGLCMAIRTLWDVGIQVDCGSNGGNKKGVAIASRGLLRIYGSLGSPNVFVLSHFHLDHYSGLFDASLKRRLVPFRISTVHYPRLPDFKERMEFFEALEAVSFRVFGAETGVMAYELLEAISRINGQGFEYEPLSAGDSIKANGSVFEVLWPPSEISKEEKILTKVRKALEDFHRAIEKDAETKRLYKRVRESGLYEKYLKRGTVRKAEETSEERLEKREPERKLPDIVKRANDSLRDAANHMCLAFFEDNRLLFFGDLEKHEIKKIVKELKSRDKTFFYVLVPPHHGTHWDDSLEEIRCFYSMSSCGRKLCSKVNPGLKKIAKRPLATCVNGDVTVPVFQRYAAWGQTPFALWEHLLRAR